MTEPWVDRAAQRRTLDDGIGFNQGLVGLVWAVEGTVTGAVRVLKNPGDYLSKVSGVAREGASRVAEAAIAYVWYKPPILSTYDHNTTTKR